MRVLAGASKPGDSSALMEQVQALDSWKKASSVLLYAPLPEEPDAALLINNQGEKRFLFPKIEGDTLGIYRSGKKSRWITGPFGLQEPDPESWEACSPAEVDLVIVPGLAFDLSGRRLGRGRGYYDRLLGLPEFIGIKIGLAWSWQLLSSVPAEEHDIRMDQVLVD
jgi:5-formyltetrahydrofolate cyclo-ligase